MGTLKAFATVGRDVSNAQETIQPLIAHAERDPRTLNALYASESSSQLQRLHGLQGFMKEFLLNTTEKNGNA